MRASVLAGLMAAGSAHAFSDSSPFLLFSTSEFRPVDAAASSPFQTDAHVLATAKALLADCPTTKYLLVSQPNVHASDLHAPPTCEAFRLRRAMTSSAVRGHFAVPEVLSKDTDNNLTRDTFRRYIIDACASKDVADVAIQELALPALPPAPRCQGRAEAMSDNDYVLGNILDDELAHGDYTVVYVSTGTLAANDAAYATADDAAQAPIQKRSAQPKPAYVRRQTAAVDTRPLFEKYQFFTPGVFMSLLVFFVLLSVLYVGLSAVSSMQVPYGAFDKAMGPSAQKKTQ